jgi:hypothetical protein
VSGEKEYSKSEVRYIDNHGSSDEQCSKCVHYVNKTTCEIVKGKINPAGWCDKFKRNNKSLRAMVAA